MILAILLVPFHHVFFIFDQCQQIRFEHDSMTYRNFMNPKNKKLICYHENLLFWRDWSYIIYFLSAIVIPVKWWFGKNIPSKYSIPIQSIWVIQKFVPWRILKTMQFVRILRFVMALRTGQWLVFSLQNGDGVRMLSEFLPPPKIWIVILVNFARYFFDGLFVAHVCFSVAEICTKSSGFMEL